MSPVAIYFSVVMNYDETYGVIEGVSEKRG
jgi:hypothetical protein